jgi:hypothetical protein
MVEMTPKSSCQCLQATSESLAMLGLALIVVMLQLEASSYQNLLFWQPEAQK